MEDRHEAGEDGREDTGDMKTIPQQQRLYTGHEADVAATERPPGSSGPEPVERDVNLADALFGGPDKGHGRKTATMETTDTKAIREEIAALEVERDELIGRKRDSHGIAQNDAARLLKNVRSKISVRRRKLREAGDDPGAMGLGSDAAATVAEDDGEETQSYAVAMRRLAERLGFVIEPTQDMDSWHVATPGGKSYDRPMSARQALGAMLITALWSKPAGEGMTPLEASRVIRLDIPARILERAQEGWHDSEIVRVLRAQDAERQRQREEKAKGVAA